MDGKKWIVFTLIAVASASHNYETSDKSSWQGRNAYNSGLPSIAIARSSLSGWSNPGNSLGRSTNSRSADTNVWSGIYRYGISNENYPSRRGWPSGHNSDGSYTDNQRNNGWTDASNGWNDVASRSGGTWNRSNIKSGINSGWQSTGW